MIRNNRTQEILSRLFGTKFFLFLLINLSVFFTSCDESSVVGLDVQPSGDLLNVGSQDTTTLITKTMTDDSLRTDEEKISNALIGKYIDPIFGETSSSLYTQLTLSTNNVVFGVTPVCDSIVVWLTYDPGYYYGKTERKQQALNVYEVTEAIPAGAKYSNKTLTTGTTTITDKALAHNFIPRPNDSVMVAGVKSKPQLRIPLDTAFGQNFLDNPSNLASNATFQAAMKGFQITTEGTTTLASGEGNIMNFKMAESRMILYYHHTGKTVVTQLDSIIYNKYDFGFGGTHFLHFTHNYSTVDPNLALQLSATPPAQNDVVFLQSMAGVKTKIELPALMNWIDSGAISVNKAELIIKADQSALYQLDTFAAPTKLFLSSIGDDGKGYFMGDINVGGTSNYYNGVYNPVTKEYRFNIARYVQQVLTGVTKNNGLFLFATSSSADPLSPLTGNVMRANRVVVGGGKNTSANQMKLNITYTKLH